MAGTLRFDTTHTSPSTQFLMYADQYSQSIEDNSSVMRVYLRSINRGNTSSFYGAAGSHIAYVNGSAVRNHSGTPFLPSGVGAGADRWYEGPYYVTVPHNADGTKAVTLRMQVNYSAHPAKNYDQSVSLTLTPIARATTPTVAPASGSTGQTFTISHAPAVSSFAHDIAYSVDGGASYTDIQTGVPGTDTSTDWTPPHSLLPNKTSVTAIVRVITRSSAGGTVIGTKTVNVPLTVPASVKPAISSVAFADAQTSGPDIPTLMGGAGRFVQRWSRLIPTVTATGAGGSTVTESTVTQAGQTAKSGTPFGQPVTVSGNVPYSAIATDSRGRVSDPYANTVPVTAYNFPNLPTPLVTRTSDAAGNVPSPTGTYLAVTPGASVSSLIFDGAQKNVLEWRVRTRPVGGAWTTKQDWTSATVSGNTWIAKQVFATYPSSQEFEVEVSIRDLFGKNGFSTAQTVVTRTVPVPSESVFMDWDGDEGIGIGGYRRPQFMLDIHGAIGQDGNAVLDESTGYTQAQVDTKFSAAATAVDSKLAGLPGRNRIINGDFRINQRNYVSAAALAVGAYGFDRWKSDAAGTSLTFTAAPQGQQVTLNSGGVIRQIIERANIESGDYVLSWTGTATARVYNEGASAPTYAASPVAVTLNGAANVIVEFTAAGGTRTLREVQLERGTTPTTFERLPYTDEILRCQRYYYVIPLGEMTVMNPYWNVALSDGGQLVDRDHPVPMRTAPTLRRADGLATIEHVFIYYNYSAAPAGTYNVRLLPSTAGFRASYSSGGSNGNVPLAVGRTAGQSNAIIQVDAEM